MEDKLTKGETAMKTFNIWRLNLALKSHTGPWEYMSAVIAASEAQAIKTAQMRYGLDGTYNVYEGL